MNGPEKQIDGWTKKRTDSNLENREIKWISYPLGLIGDKTMPAAKVAVKSMTMVEIKNKAKGLGINPGKMNKTDLINEVAKVLNSKKDAQEVINCIFESMEKALKKKESINITGFGTFSVNKRKARTGRNPRTGEEIKIAARNVMKFSPGKALKESVN